MTCPKCHALTVREDEHQRLRFRSCFTCGWDQYLAAATPEAITPVVDGRRCGREGCAVPLGAGQARFCSRRCTRLSTKHAKECRRCGQTFEAGNTRREYCSGLCREKAISVQATASARKSWSERAAQQQSFHAVFFPGRRYEVAR